MGLDSVELMLLYEAEFKIEIPEKEAAQMLTPRLVAAGIEKILKIENRPIEREIIDKAVKRITIDYLNLDERNYHVDASYVNDFGVD